MTTITPRLSDWLIGLGLSAAAQAEVWLGSSSADRFVAAGCALLGTLPLVRRRRAPLTVLVTLVGATLLQSALTQPPGGPWTALAVLIAVFTVASRDSEAAAVAGAALALGAFVVAILDAAQTPHAADFVFSAVVVAGVALAGGALRRRRLHGQALEEHATRLEREREERARAAVADERARIARELHDVVAHNVSVAVVQAEAGEALLDRDPEAARQALVSIQNTGRQALAELSRLLGIMRKDHEAPALDPPPSITRLPALIDQVEAAGLAVDVLVEGRPRTLTPGVDLAAYRIIQEALTNSLKHAGPGHAAVTVRYAERALELEVRDDGAGETTVRTDGGGHGLVGMRERVALYGGELEAGRRPQGGFGVRARLPLEPTGRP